MKLRDCLLRTGKIIRDWTPWPRLPLWSSVLRDIYGTLHEIGVSVLENEPYPPGSEQPPAEPQPPTVLVIVYGGVVQSVQKTDPNVRVIVRDYDCDGRDEVECGLQRDGDGDLYAEWEER